MLRAGWVGSRALLASMLCIASVMAACGRSDAIPSLEIRAQQINQSVMCPVCPGESIDQSQHPLAVQMRGIVAEKLREGWTADQIRADFVDGYGPSVLLEPPRSGLNLMVWIVPPAAVVLAAGLLFLVLRSMARRSSDADEPSGPMLTDEERAVYFTRIEAVESANGPGASADATQAAERPGSAG